MASVLREQHSVKRSNFTVQIPPTTVQICDAEAWSIVYRQRGSNGDYKIVPFKCGSWRHPGPCSEKCATNLLDRIREGLFSHAPLWSIITLSLPGNYYREAARRWKRLHRALTKRAAARFLIVTSRRPGLLRLTIVASSLPDVSELNRLAGMAGFKIQKVRTASVSETVTELEPELRNPAFLPLNAPPNTRQWRQSSGLLPPPKKSEKEGKLLKVPAKVLQHLKLPGPKCPIALVIASVLLR